LHRLSAKTIIAYMEALGMRKLFLSLLILCLLSTAALAAVTMAQYEKVNTGMTYSEVISILGTPNQELSRAEMAGITTVMYMWEGNSIGGNMNVMFQNGKVVTKAQFGLK
jgi:hypothetical protein